MPVPIKDVELELYRKFKTRAIKKGLKIDEAFSEAIIVWLNSSGSRTPRERIQEKNELAYRLLKRTLESEYSGKWVSIIDGELAATAETREDLIEQLKIIKRNTDPALLFQVGRPKRNVTLALKAIRRKN